MKEDKKVYFSPRGEIVCTVCGKIFTAKDIEEFRLHMSKEHGYIVLESIIK